MKSSSRSFIAHARAWLAALVMAAASPAMAQDSSGTGILAPGSGRPAMGLSIGVSHWNPGCRPLGACDDPDRHLHLYGRSMFNDRWGAQLGLLDLGDAERGGTESRARGMNLSLVGRVPLGAKFSGWGRVGTTYGHTSTSQATGAGLTSGGENGFGLSYGLGLSWQFSPQLSAVFEWDSHDFRFAGSGRDPVRATSLGLQYRY